MNPTPKIAVLASGDDLLRAINSAAGRLPGVALEVAAPAEHKTINGWARGSAAIVLEIDASRAPAHETFQRFAGSAPGKILVAARAASSEDVRRLFRAGAADVLIPPFTEEAMRGALGELLALNGGRTPPPSEGRVVAVVKGCGGAGATSFALNAAALLLEREPKTSSPARRLAALDFDLQFGDCDIALDLRPRSTIMDVLRARERFDRRFLESVMVEGRPGLSLLASPPGVVPLDALDVSLALSIVEHAAAGHDYVLIDLPSAWTDWTGPVLQRADLVVLITNASVPGTAGARRVLNASKDAGVETPVFLVLNRLAGPLERVEHAGRIGRTLEIEVGATLALDPAASRATDRGRLVVDAFGKAPVSRDLKAATAKLQSKLTSAARTEPSLVQEGARA
jgi:pilus assembly protein CpaE